jgi:hypothetical protein
MKNTPASSGVLMRLIYYNAIAARLASFWTYPVAEASPPDLVYAKGAVL